MRRLLLIGDTRCRVYNVKAGVVGLTKSVAVHCANEGFNIRCNSIHQAQLTNILKTAIEQAPEVEEACNKMSPLNRMGTVEEVAAMALFWPLMRLVSVLVGSTQLKRARSVSIRGCNSVSKPSYPGVC